MIGKKRLRRYCKEFQEIENYQEALRSSELYHLHHRKEIETLEDGTVVLRPMRELKELGLYYHRPPEELIFLKHSEHNSLPKFSEESKAKMSAARRGKKHSPEHIAKISGDKNPMYGRTGEKSPMFGRIGDKHPSWKGDLATDHTKYMRLRNQKKREALCNSLNF